MYKDIIGAIRHEHCCARENEVSAERDLDENAKQRHMNYAKEHYQVEGWLKELKALKDEKEYWDMQSNIAYEQGRQDEREEWERAVADKIIKHDEDIYKALPEVIEKVRADAEKEYLLNTYGLTVKIADAEKQRIRTEAIDECIELIEHGCFISGTAGNCLRRHMEQLKESKECKNM